LATCELPAVIVDIMRGGPGLGNIGPEQSDYNQVVKGGGHGNYKCIVLAPNSSQEMCDLTLEAFILAERYRIPVYVLTDGVIGQMLESVILPDPIPPRLIPDWALAGTRKSRRNFLTSIYLDHDDLENVNLHLQDKYRQIQEQEQRSESYFLEDAELVLIGYGIISRLLRSAVEELRDEGLKVGMLRPVSLFPFPKDIINACSESAKHFLCVEMSNGQMVDDVRLTIDCRKPVHFYGRMGGHVPTTTEIMEQCRQILSKQDK